jgi:hypothetical protein
VSVGVTVEHVAHDERQQCRIGARRGGDVEVGVVGRLGAPGIDDDQLRTARPQVAEVPEGIGHHQPVPVGDHGVDPDGEQQIRRRQVRGELQLHAGDELGHEELARAVDAQRAVHRRRAERPEEALGEGVAGRVERAAGAGVAGDRGRAVLGHDGRQAGGDVVERFVPRRRRQLAVDAGQRDVEAARVVVELGPGAPFVARVALRPRIIGIARDAHHLLAVELDDRAAADGADAAGRPRLPDHQRSLPGDRSSGTTSPASAYAWRMAATAGPP